MPFTKVGKYTFIKPTVALHDPEEGNAFVILGAVSRALYEANKEHLTPYIASQLVTEYHNRATQGDYDHLKEVTQQYCNITFSTRLFQ